MENPVDELKGNPVYFVKDGFHKNQIVIHVRPSFFFPREDTLVEQGDPYNGESDRILIHNQHLFQIGTF